MSFKIEITCKKCESKEVEVDLWMSQGTGLLDIRCVACGNNPSNSLDTQDLQNIIDGKGELK